MSDLLGVTSNGHQSHLSAAFVFMTVLVVEVFARSRWCGGLPVAEAAPSSLPNAQISSTRGFVQFTVDGSEVWGM